jgi:hypothetical protein
MADPDLRERSRRNLARLEDEFRREMSQVCGASAEETERAMAIERLEVGDHPPIAVNMNLVGLATVLGHGRLFSVWDVVEGRVEISEPLRAYPSLAESNWSRGRRETVERAVGALVVEARRPIYAALSSSTGYDRMSGGMFDHCAYPATIELPWTAAPIFHWGDSFDAIAVDDQTRFDPDWCLAPEDALRAKAMINLVRRRNFPIVGRADYGPDHPERRRLLTLSHRVTSLWIEAFVYDALPLSECPITIRTAAIAAPELPLLAMVRERLPTAFSSVIWA